MYGITARPRLLSVTESIGLPPRPKAVNMTSLMQFSIDDGPHNMDGLRLYAQDGAGQVEAFIGRKVLDVWAESIEHRGGAQSLFRDQYNALGKLNLAALQRMVSANTREAPRPTGSIPLSRYCSRTSRKAVRILILPDSCASPCRRRFTGSLEPDQSSPGRAASQATLVHDPEKCVAAFRKDHAQTKG